jgi:hypothetical protein
MQVLRVPVGVVPRDPRVPVDLRRGLPAGSHHTGPQRLLVHRCAPVGIVSLFSYFVYHINDFYYHGISSRFFCFIILMVL